MIIIKTKNDYKEAGSASGNETFYKEFGGYSSEKLNLIKEELSKISHLIDTEITAEFNDYSNALIEKGVLPKNCADVEALRFVVLFSEQKPTKDESQIINKVIKSAKNKNACTL